MDVSKTIIAALIVATLSSQALSAPLQSPPSTVEILVTYLIPQRVINATQEMKNLYQFITSTSYLQNSVIMLPNINTQSCTSSQQLSEKLTLAYKKLFIFRSPLFMTFSYEENQGPLHSLLAQVVRDTSSYVNATTVMLRRQMGKNSFPVPTVHAGYSEANLDQFIRGHLQMLHNHTIVNLVITDDVVKIYRNYVILYSLSDVIREVAICVSGI